MTALDLAAMIDLAVVAACLVWAATRAGRRWKEVEATWPT